MTEKQTMVVRTSLTMKEPQINQNHFHSKLEEAMQKLPKVKEAAMSLHNEVEEQVSNV